MPLKTAEAAEKRILCFGDSNTWGYIAGTGERQPAALRWAGVMAAKLGEGWTVIEEGLNGRTTVWDDPVELKMSGFAYLTPCLMSHKPLDLVIIMLGSNDLKCRFSVTPRDIGASAGKLVKLVKQSDTGRNRQAPPVLLVSPPAIGKHLSEGLFAYEFPANAPELSAEFPHWFRRSANEMKCNFFDAAPYCSTGPDALHLDTASHARLGEALADRVRQICL